jgi:hypothetical protein
MFILLLFFFVKSNKNGLGLRQQQSHLQNIKIYSCAGKPLLMGIDGGLIWQMGAKKCGEQKYNENNNSHPSILFHHSFIPFFFGSFFPFF